MRRLLIDLRRRTQSAVLRRARGSRAFPQTLVNRLGEDARLESASTPAAVMVYFPGAPDTLYQVVPWLPTFEAVHRAHGAVIVCQDSRVAAVLRRDSSVPVITIARYGTLDGLLARSDVKLALYVSHLPRNFEGLRFSSLLHAYIGHGDSDKGVSASNQLKAYDLFLAPGQAAVDRVALRLMRYDTDDRTRVVGQPITLSPPPQDRAAEPGERTTVLYAPTWEGAQPSVAYSSVASHGEALVAALLADPRYRVLYRPHPLTGVMLRGYAVADRAIRDRITAAGGGSATVPVEEPLETTFARADALVTDVSGVATAWLPSLRPVVVTRAVGDAVSADSGMLGAVPRLDAADADDAPAVVAAALADAEGRATRAALVAHYLSPYWPDRSIERFVEVVGALLADRDRMRADLLDRGATGV